MRTETRRIDAVTSVPLNRYVTFTVLAIGGLVWDLYSKSWVFAELGYPSGQSQWSRDFLSGWVTMRLFTSMNEGALWGMGQGYAWLFAALSLVAAAGILYWLFAKGAASSLWLTIALGLIMAGTLGNLYDRLGLHGCVDPRTSTTWYAVRDFLAFTFDRWSVFQFEFQRWTWPIFNFADVYLVTGTMMLFVQAFAPQPGDEDRDGSETGAPQTAAAD